MFKRLSALCAATAAALALGCADVGAAYIAEKKTHNYSSAVLFGLDDNGNKAGFSSVTDITGISAITFSFRVDEALAARAVSGEIDFFGTVGTESDTLGRVAHEWAFAPYQLDDEGEVVYGDDLSPLTVKELTMEKVMDGYYTLTLENPTGFFKDEDTYARVWFDTESDEYDITLTGVVLSFDDSSIVKSLINSKMTLTQDSFTYTGSACKPKASISYGSRFLKEGTDFTLSYKNNINAGTATVTATGKGKYRGSISKTFSITSKALSGAAVTLPKGSYAYTGSKVKPVPTVTLGGKKLVSGKDYTVTYTKNTAVGTATVKVTGKGNYKGTILKSFGIVPKATVIKSAVSSKTKQATVKWAKNTTAEGYQILYSQSSGFSGSKTKTAAASKTSLKIGSLTKGKTYYFKVRAYKTVNGTKYYGAYSSVKSVKIK